MRASVNKLMICLAAFLCAPLYAQTHSSVPLGNQIYSILEHAEISGLCAPLPGTRPYPQSVVTAAVREILNSEKAPGLKTAERDILNQYLAQFSKPKQGIDWRNGSYYAETAIGKNGVPISTDVSLIADVQGSSGVYLSGENYFGTEIWLGLRVSGDLGRNVSYGFIFEGGLVKTPRNELGDYWTYYESYEPGNKINPEPDDEYVNRKIKIYSEPVTHFPYTYKKRWDGSVFFFSELSSYETWPNGIAGGYSLPAELTASFLDNRLTARLGRISREWGSSSFGSSLAFNQMARPFLGIEAEFAPVSWFGISSLTGFLEYYNYEGIKDSAASFQNAFSVTMFQFRYKNYLFLDFIDAVVYPKRFELGYGSPITSNFFYQNNLGDFDNMAVTLNLKAQYPGLGSIWFSLFVDEMNLTSDLPTLDRQMVAMQGGMNIPLPFLSFTSLKLSYTKINPYCYTHNRNFNPWYSDIRMETPYANNGVNLGYYLPPNSDEILARFNTVPVKNMNMYLQYQLIRHGADFGLSAVDGSNLLSELDPEGRDTKPVLKRFFLQDGAYQWLHVARIGAEWNLPKLPVALYGEAGAVISYFTNIEGPANAGKASPYSIVDTPDYPKSTGFIVKLGFRLFQK
jgi:hypothetical protein